MAGNCIVDVCLIDVIFMTASLPPIAATYFAITSLAEGALCAMSGAELANMVVTATANERKACIYRLSKHAR